MSLINLPLWFFIGFVYDEKCHAWIFSGWFQKHPFLEKHKSYSSDECEIRIMFGVEAYVPTLPKDQTLAPVRIRFSTPRWCIKCGPRVCDWKMPPLHHRRENNLSPKPNLEPEKMGFAVYMHTSESWLSWLFWTMLYIWRAPTRKYDRVSWA